MRNRLILLGLAATVTAMFALPAAASAGEWSIHNSKGTNPSFTMSMVNPKFTVNGEAPITCGTSSGNGAYTTPTTGNMTLTFHNCTESTTGSSCTSPGQPAGTITTGSHVFHNIHLEPFVGQPEPTLKEDTNKIGILITGGGSLEHFTCTPLGITTTITVTGNIIGEVTKPTCTSAASTAGTVVFATHEVKEGEPSPTQQWEQVTTAGTLYDLVEDVTQFGSTTEHTAAWDSTATLTYSSSIAATCL